MLHRQSGPVHCMLTGRDAAPTMLLATCVRSGTLSELLTADGHLDVRLWDYVRALLRRAAVQA